MKKTILGLSLVILTMVTASANARTPAQKNNRNVEYLESPEYLVKVSKELYASEKRNHLSWSLRPGAVANIGQEVKIQSHVVPIKVFNLDEQTRVENAPDAGSTRILSQGYFRVLAMTRNQAEFLVEHSPLEFSTITSRPSFSRSTSKETRTTATEVFLITAEDLEKTKKSDGVVYESKAF